MKNNNNFVLMCIVKVKKIGGITLDRPLLCLLDTGSTSTLIQRQALSFGCTPRLSVVKQVMTTANGSFNTLESVSLNSIKLPKFVNNHIVNCVNDACLFDFPNTKYNIIFGRWFFWKCKMWFYFDTNAVEWLGKKIEMKLANYFNTIFNRITDIKITVHNRLTNNSYIGWIAWISLCWISKQKFAAD